MAVTKPDWSIWANKQFAKLWRCVALSFDAEPGTFANASQLAMRLNQWESSQFQTRLTKAQGFVGPDRPLPATDYFALGENHEVSIDDFIALADHLRWSIPDGMRERTPSQFDMSSSNEGSEETSPLPENGKPLRTLERESLLKIIIALAIHGLGYKPEDKKSPIPREVADAMQRLGIPLDVDTVRNKLKKAAELLSAANEKN